MRCRPAVTLILLAEILSAGCMFEKQWTRLKLIDIKFASEGKVAQTFSIEAVGESPAPYTEVSGLMARIDENLKRVLVEAWVIYASGNLPGMTASVPLYTTIVFNEPGIYRLEILGFEPRGMVVPFSIREISVSE